jgi:hypothetical protein
MSEKIRYWSTELSPTKRVRGRRKHHLALPRRVASKKRSAGLTAYDRASQAAFPWAPEAYPGLLRGMLELLDGRAAVRTILDWRRGRRRPPSWAIDVLQEALKVRVKTMTVSIEELEKEKAARLTPL